MSTKEQLLSLADDLDKLGFEIEAAQIDGLMLKFDISKEAQDSGVAVSRALHFIGEALKRNQENETYLSSVQSILEGLRE